MFNEIYKLKIPTQIIFKILKNTVFKIPSSYNFMKVSCIGRKLTIRFQYSLITNLAKFC